MRLEALIFDVDGTLADTEECHRDAFNEAFAACGLDWHWDRTTYRALLDVTGGCERIAHDLETRPMDDAERTRLRATVRALHAEKTRRYTRRIAEGRVALRPGIARLVGEARARGVRLAIATTTSPANVTALLEATLGTGAIAWFASIVCGDAVERKKPAPDAYHRVLERLRLPARACLAIEDSANGLRAAQAAGVCTVVTPTAWTEDHDFSGAAEVFDSLGDPACGRVRDGMPIIDLAALERIHATYLDAETTV